jgi:membrane dipeptidase
MRRWIVRAALVLVVIAAALFFFVVPPVIDRLHNSVHRDGAKAISTAAAGLHGQLLVADLHGDTLLWNRDLLRRSEWGHIDVPRLIEGNVALQAFSVVTKTPRGINYQANRADTDNITLLAIAQRWPPAAWRSLVERALFQARRLHYYARQSEGKLTIIASRAELASYLAARERNREITAGWLTIEGAHALEGDLANLDRLYDAGFRMIAPSHFFDTEIGGSAHGLRKGGLTELGKKWVARMEAKRMIVDLAHASPQTIDDVLALARRPVFVSHTGVLATCATYNRNLSDEQLRRIAATGGVIGIGFWEFATCGKDVAAVVGAIQHALGVIGANHIALGSDWDGYVASPIDAAGVARITDALFQAGVAREDIAKIMGGNVIRLLLQLLP